jgi:hypothetical protein
MVCEKTISIKNQRLDEKVRLNGKKMPLVTLKN